MDLLKYFFDIAYLLVLAQTYRRASLSMAYPMIRGTTPIATTLFSFLFFGLTVKYRGLLGILIMVIGILFINQQKFSFAQLWMMLSKNMGNLKWIFLTGVVSALGVIIDGMGALTMSAILFKYVVFIGVFVGKWAIDRQGERQISYIFLFRRYPLESILGALLLFATNALTTYAMKTAPVTYVVAVREISIIFAATIGVIWLKERISLVRWASICLIIAGVILIKTS